MTGLTRIAITARKVIRYGIFFIIFLTVGKIVLDLSVGVYKKIFPAPPPPPTVKFGKLTKIPFPSGPSAKLSYSLETPEGGLPTNIPTQAKVFFMPKANPNLLSLDVAKEKAKALQFTGGPLQESDTLYKFNDPNFPTVMEINIVTGTFSISYDLSSDRSPIDQKPPVAEIAASIFRGKLSNANDLPDDLSQGPVTHDFFKFTSQGLTPALSLSESDVTKVNLFRKNYDNLPSVTGNPNEANVWAIISGSTNQEQQIIAAEYHYHPVDETQYSTYPIKTPTEAMNELESGQGYIAGMGKYKDGDAVTIRRIYLAYFDPEAESDFFQPVYVFDSNENDPGLSFKAYIPAVASSYYGQ